MKLIFAISALLVAFWWWSPSEGEIAQISVVSVYDGDTFTAVVDGVTERIRLARIDAPEIPGERASLAKEALIAFLAKGNVVIRDCGRGYYGRIIGEVSVNGINASDYLVERGFADYKDYSGINGN